MSSRTPADGVLAGDRARTPFLLAIGDPLVALTPKLPVALEDTDELTVWTGGAEINTAIGVSRLGVASGWLGRVGDDPLGRRVLRSLRGERVDTSLIVVDPDAPTGLYLREWLPDGLRRPHYYRHGGAGTRLSRSDWPTPWPTAAPVPTVVHVTGITAALSDGAAEAIESMVRRSRASGYVVSVDPNYRPMLWPDRQTARQRLGALVAEADLLLLSEEDATLLFDTDEPQLVRDAVGGLRASVTVFKRGAAGAVVWRGEQEVAVPAEPITASVDPVGAGDAFNAGFLAATMLDLDLTEAAQCGAWCGARAVERVGESTGYPMLAELPDDLRHALSAALAGPGAASREQAAR